MQSGVIRMLELNESNSDNPSLTENRHLAKFVEDLGKATTQFERGQIFHAVWVMENIEDKPRVDLRLYKEKEQYHVLYQTKEQSFKTTVKHLDAALLVLVSGNLGVWIENHRAHIAILNYAKVGVEISYVSKIQDQTEIDQEVIL